MRYRHDRRVIIRRLQGGVLESGYVLKIPFLLRILSSKQMYVCQPPLFGDDVLSQVDSSPWGSS
jgi:hypothetical protein